MSFLNMVLLFEQINCGGSESGTTGGSSWTWIIMIVMIVALFALMIIPQRRRDKKVKDMLSGIKVGDRVRTIGGIYGTVTSIKDDVIILSVGPDKVRLVFARGAIATIEDAPVETTINGEVKDVK